MSIQVTSADGSVEVVKADQATPTETEVKAKSADTPDEDAPEAEEPDPSEAADTDDDDVEGDGDDKDADKDSQDKPPKKKGGYQKRIERFQRKLIERELEIERLKREALERQDPAKAKKADTPVVETQFTRPKPKPSDFDTNEEYVDGLTDWKIEQSNAKNEADRRAAELKSQVQESQRTFMEKLGTFRKTATDWDEVISDVSDLLIPAAVTAAVEESGPELMYALAKDRDTLERMTKLSTAAALRELGAFEAKLSQAKAAAVVPQKVSKAPTPLSTVKPNGGSARKKTIYDENLSLREYEELRASQSTRF